MQEKSLESTEIFKIFRGSIPPYPPSVARYFALNILCLRTPFNETRLWRPDGIDIKKGNYWFYMALHGIYMCMLIDSLPGFGLHFIKC